MPTKIKVTLFENAEQWIKDEIENIISISSSDSVTSFRYRSGDLNKMEFGFDDTEDGTRKVLRLPDLVKALQLLCDQIAVTVEVGMIKSPRELTDTCNWDVEVADAFLQLAYHGEVIYG